MTLDILPIFDTHTKHHYVSSGATSTTNNTTTFTSATIYQPQTTTSSNKPNVNCLLNGYMLNHELRFIRKIGAGTYGLIYLVENIYTKQQFAAKMVLEQPLLKQKQQQQQQQQSHHGHKGESGMNKQIILQEFYQYFLNNSMPQPQNLDLNYLRDNGHDCPFLTEISLHLKVHQHPNIATIHQVLNIEDFAIIILMDHFEQGDLFTNIIDRQIFTSNSHRKVPRTDFETQLLMKNAMLQLIEAIEYCHENNIYHCDLKPENIMVRYNPYYVRPTINNNNNNGEDDLCYANSIIDYNELHLVLIDFGLAMDSATICCNSCRGSSFYMAPERTTNYNTHRLINQLIDMNQYESIEINGTTVTKSNCKYLPTLAGDIWSLGVLFINITCSRNPWPIASFDNNQNNEVFKNYMLNNNKAVLSKILPISSQFNRLLDRIFKLNPNDRIDLPTLYKEVIRCDFFKDDHYYYAQHQHQHHHNHNQINNAYNHYQKQPNQARPTANQQLYTPPETTTYNSYASDMEEDEISDDEFYSDEEDEDIEEYEEEEEEYFGNEQQQQQQVTTVNGNFGQVKGTCYYDTKTKTTTYIKPPAAYTLETPSQSVEYC